jgi:hypothetical protein
MTARLRRIQALLTAGNVICDLSEQDGLGTVLLAGTPNPGPWEVAVWEAGGTLWLNHKGETVELNAGGSDGITAAAIKVRVVDSWADQGDPESMAFMAMIDQVHRPRPPESLGQNSFRTGHTTEHQGLDPASSAAWVIDQIRRESVPSRVPMWAFDLESLAANPSELAHRISRQYLIDLNNRGVVVVRNAIQRAKRAGAHSVLVRVGLMLPVEWRNHYERLCVTEYPAYVSVVLVNAFSGNSYAGERLGWSPDM